MYVDRSEVPNSPHIRIRIYSNPSTSRLQWKNYLSSSRSNDTAEKWYQETWNLLGRRPSLSHVEICRWPDHRIGSRMLIRFFQQRVTFSDMNNVSFLKSTCLDTIVPHSDFNFETPLILKKHTRILCIFRHFTLTSLLRRSELLMKVIFNKVTFFPTGKHLSRFYFFAGYWPDRRTWLSQEWSLELTLPRLANGT